MRRNSGIAAIVGLIALVLLPMAALAIAPIAKELPDLRGQIIAGGGSAVVLDLDDYAIDADSRNQATSAQTGLTWSDTSTNTTITAGQELQADIPIGTAPVNEVDTLTVTDGSGNDTSTCRLHTATGLLGGPLVDTQIGGGWGDGALIPYFWAVEAGQTGTLEIPFAAGGASTLTAATGFSQISLYAASQVANPADPIAQYDGTVTKTGTTSTAPLGLANAGNLSIDADLNGLAIVPLTGFSGWARVTVTRQFAANDYDSYTVAIADFLNGTNENLSGAGTGDSQISTVAENYNFENLTVTQFLGMASSAAYNSATDPDRLAATRDTQATNWMVTTGSYAGGALNGSTMPDLAITADGKPAATYPGATDGNALKVTFNQPVNQTIFLTHKGIKPDQYDPGDVLTFSVNSFFDLGYTGGAADEMINEPTNGLSLIMAVNTLPNALSQNLNIISYAPPPSAFANLRRGTGNAPLYGRGGSQAINSIALLDGKWTRHEVSFRVPQFGQAIEGSAGTGNVADSIGMGAQLFLGRTECQAAIPQQTVWLDNFAITRCPGALALAYGSIEVPMISAGFSLPFNNGTDSGPGAVFVNANFYGDVPMPAALARGQAIYGSASQGGTGSAQTVTPKDPSTFFGTAPVAHPDALNNAKAGFVEVNTNTDVAIIGTGGADVALAFPVLDDGNRALVLGPAGLAGNPFTTPATNVAATGHAGSVQVQASFLDMRLGSSAATPGLRVDDVIFNGGEGGNANGENGYLNPDRVLGNMSGVYGVRWFTKSNAPSVAYNPRLDVTLLNADVSLGLVAQRTAPVLPSDDNSGIADDAWSDDFVSGSVITFCSFMKYYDLILNNQTTPGNGFWAGQVPAGTISGLQTANPGAQLGYVNFSRSNSYNCGNISAILTNANLKGFDNIFQTGTNAPNPDVLPGRYSSAVLSVDEIHVLSVRDTGAFFDEDLQ